MTLAQPFPGDPPVDAALAAAHKLTRDEYERVVAALGRAPTYAELGVVSVMWSEHCSYKSSRVHLSRLPTKGPRVIQGPGENAGVVDIGDGLAAVFKMESHNHPSYLEPYQGAATGVGGILRDVFTMGARPIASLDSLRFGRPDHPKTAALLRGVVAGIGGYGNCVGVPTVGGELFFDAAYDGNILVNAFTCGVARADRIFYGRASGVGNAVIYVGAKTGRDGIHGATMASDEFSAQGPSQRPTVQVGDPFLEKLLIEACLEIFAEDLLIGIQDMGAAGLTSSSVEMAARAGSGLAIDLDLVPRRARGMRPYELLLSESQERMLLVCKPGKEPRVREICAKWELDAAVIGRVTDTGRWIVKATPGYDPLRDSGDCDSGDCDSGDCDSGDCDSQAERDPIAVCDLPVGLLADEAPRYDRPQADDPTLTARLSFDPRTLADPPSFGDQLLRMAGSPNLGSRQWVWRQYDQIVRGGTAVRPGDDAAVVRVGCGPDGPRGATERASVDKWLAFAVDCNARLCDLDPFAGAALAVAEACRNLCCAGAEPIGLSDCLNFGSPTQPHVMRQFSRAIDGIAAACRALGVPVVSGNVSFYNETDGRAILPTPTIAAVGLFASRAHITRSRFAEPGRAILLLGPARGGPLGGSEYLVSRTGAVQGPPPSIDLSREASVQRLLLAAIRDGLVRSAHDVSEGGLAIALAECCAPDDEHEPQVGAEIALPEAEDTAAEALFGEAPSRVAVSALPDARAEIAARAKTHGIPCIELGRTGGDRLVIRRAGTTLVDVAVAQIAARRRACLDPIVGPS